MRKTKGMRYISYNKATESYRVRVPGAGQITVKTLDNAIQERDRRLNLIEKGKINIDPQMTFKQWFDIWLERYCTSNNPRTKEGYKDDKGAYPAVCRSERCVCAGRGNAQSLRR